VQYPMMDGIEVELDGSVLTVRFARPDSYNAVTPDQCSFVGTLFRLAERDDDVRVVVLTGSGAAFCAGADLKNVDLSASGGQIPAVTAEGNPFLPLLELSKPLIGAVNGVAAGGGLGYALCCDLRVASERARFSVGFGRIGITANDTIAWLLPRIVGVAKALELIYLSRPIDAAESERIGLASYVVGHDQLDAKVKDLATAFAEGPPFATRLSKRLVLDGLNRSYRDHVMSQEYASLANRMIADHDIKEGAAAFKEKRPPRFRGMSAERRWSNY
jgi:2-(1,2-epoxy-1,2-dihydrophenyl)acetyl-CoA isomerase